jgi:hypothetical protein
VDKLYNALASMGEFKQGEAAPHIVRSWYVLIAQTRGLVHRGEATAEVERVLNILITEFAQRLETMGRP